MIDRTSGRAPVAHTSMRSRLSGRNTRSIAIFVSIACALAWILALPLWLGDGLASPLFPVTGVATMATPAVTALIMVFFVDRERQKARRLGLWPLKPVRRLVGYGPLGCNYPDAPVWLGVSVMVGVCIIFGAIFGWLRLRSSSVWPAAHAHAALNGAGGTFLLFMAAGEHVDTTQATELGWSGWIVLLALVVVLVATGQFHRPVATRSAAEAAPAAIDLVASTSNERTRE